MAHHVTIEIKVAYDEAHPRPTLAQLETAVDTVVGLGMLADETGDSVIEEWTVTAMDTTVLEDTAGPWTSNALPDDV